MGRGWILAALAAAVLGACTGPGSDELRQVNPTEATGDRAESVNAYLSLEDGTLTVLAVGEADSEDTAAITPHAKRIAWALRDGADQSIASGTIVDPRVRESEFDEQLLPARIEA